MYNGKTIRRADLEAPIDSGWVLRFTVPGGPKWDEWFKPRASWVARVNQLVLDGSVVPPEEGVIDSFGMPLENDSVDGLLVDWYRGELDLRGGGWINVYEVESFDPLFPRGKDGDGWARLDGQWSAFTASADPYPEGESWIYSSRKGYFVPCQSGPEYP